MLSTWELGKIGGIQVRIHWTFWLLMIFYALTTTLSDGVVAGVTISLMLGLVFLCVMLHEFGHAFAARAFGIPTHDITLLPFGGLARLARMPDRPYQELLIALAGPAVNVVIALMLLPLMPLADIASSESSSAFVLDGGLIANLLAANVILVLFNMLPAFPMDGGRVLRSLLAMRLTHLRATEIAARVGRWMALAFIVLGPWYGHWELALVGLFVLISGTMELFSARRQAVGQALDSAAPGFRFQWSSVRGGQWPPVGPDGFPPGQPEHRPVAQRDDVIDAVDVRKLN